MLFRGEMSERIFKSVCGDRKELCDGIASLRASNSDFLTLFENGLRNQKLSNQNLILALLAQLDRASVYGTEG